MIASFNIQAFIHGNIWVVGLSMAKITGRKKSPSTFRAWVTFILGHLQGCYTWEPLFNERRSWIPPLSFHFLINRVLPALPRYFHVKAHCWPKHPDTEFFPILTSVPDDPSGFLSCVWWAVHWYPSEWMPCGLPTCFSKLREVFKYAKNNIFSGQFVYL